ncbi:MAG: flagellar biosynthesis protein FlgA, partial [Clostridia bacterium]
IGGIKKSALRVNELPIVYATRDKGGLLEKENTIDIFTLLRTKEEASMGGGIFLVVKCSNDYSQHILIKKSLIGNYDNSAAVMVQPYHLCGVESSTSLITCALLGVNTGSYERTMRYDLVRIAKKDLPAGTLCTHDRDVNLITKIVPASCKAPDAPIPAHMLNRNKLKVDVKAGQTITYEMVEVPEDSLLWQLREKAEAHFLK